MPALCIVYRRVAADQVKQFAGEREGVRIEKLNDRDAERIGYLPDETTMLMQQILARSHELETLVGCDPFIDRYTKFATCHQAMFEVSNETPSAGYADHDRAIQPGTSRPDIGIKPPGRWAS
ncbi:MAG: hypothetical protein INR70_07865 [Parafilimonas terrae]|nr:hypothetical protein [Parafilimonas terrae]